jgi:hypothetical protein
LYIINKDTLYCVNGHQDSPTAKIVGKAGNWPGFGAISYKLGRLYVAEQYLYEVDPKTGKTNRLGDLNWSGTTAMTFLGDTALYIVQNGALHAVSPFDGRYWVKGDVGTWTGQVSMATPNLRKLYLTQDEKLWRVDPNTGRREVLGDGVWKDPTYLAASGGILLAMENKRFYHVDVNTGKWTQKGGYDWPTATALTASNYGTAFAIESNRLWRINVDDGSYVKLSDGWTGESVMVAVADRSCY